MDFLAVACNGTISDLHIQDTQILRRNMLISIKYFVQKKYIKISATQNGKKSLLFGDKNVDIFATNEDFCKFFFDTFSKIISPYHGIDKQ